MDKTLALGQWAQGYNPEVEVYLHSLQIGSTPIEPDPLTEYQRLAGVLNDTDLLVSATAEHDVNRQLDQAAIEMGVPRLYLWSVSGYGGIVALLRSGHTGCFHCLEALLTEQAQAGTPLVGAPPDDDRGLPPGTIQGLGCADKTFTAPQADLLPIVIHAARITYGHLCDDGRNGDGGDGESGDVGGYPRMSGDVFAVQIREVDGTPIPPRWSTHSLPARPECPICNAS